MKNRKMEVAVLGALNIDICGASNVPYSAGDSLPGEVGMTLGGVGFNIVRNAAALGADCAFFSVLGEDYHAPQIRAEAARLGLNLDGCEWVEADNCRYLFILDHRGDMTAAVNDMKLTRRMDAAFGTRVGRAMAEAAVAVAEANLPAETLQRVAAELGETPLVADCVSAAKCMRLEKILPRIHTLKANLLEAGRLTGFAGPERCATALLKKGVKRVVITLGPEGMLLAEGERMLRLPSLAETVVNASGAGDAMTAALAVALLRGMDAETAAKFAGAAAAVTVQSPAAVSPELCRLRAVAERRPS